MSLGIRELEICPIGILRGRRIQTLVGAKIGADHSQAAGGLEIILHAGEHHLHRGLGRILRIHHVHGAAVHSCDTVSSIERAAQNDRGDRRHDQNNHQRVSRT